MSNYTIAVAWSGKDALSDSDAAKVISGADFNTEFTAVQTAINTKADVNGSATESFSATTATAGTNTTQVATTAFVTAALDLVFPVGAIFTTVTAYANSAAVVAAIGGTTWVSFAAGKMLIGVDSGDTDFDTVEETGGAKTHTLTEAEMPSHRHIENIPRDNHGSGPAQVSSWSSGDAPDDDHYEHYTGYTGGTGATETSAGTTQAHSIMNPYITVYMWKRTA
jgi:hypothetical protein